MKIIRALIINIKATMLNTNTNILTNSLNKQQKPGAVGLMPTSADSSDLHTMVHNYLNYVLSLSYIALKRPQLFINENLTEFLCTNFLFSSKSDKQFSNGSGLSSALGAKAKSIHNHLSSAKGIGLTVASTAAAAVVATTGASTAQLGSSSLSSASPTPTNMISDVLATICELFMLIYDGEDNWPEVFVRAYLDDSIAERNWVDSAACRPFIDNVRTAFATKPIPQQQSSGLAAITDNGDSMKGDEETPVRNQIQN